MRVIEPRKPPHDNMQPISREVYRQQSVINCRDTISFYLWHVITDAILVFHFFDRHSGI